MGLPWWSSSKESTCQCRGHGCNLGSGKSPHASGQLSPCITTTEPRHLEPVLHNEKSHLNETPTHHSQRGTLQLDTAYMSNQDPAEPKVIKLKNIYMAFIREKLRQMRTVGKPKQMPNLMRGSFKNTQVRK